MSNSSLEDLQSSNSQNSVSSLNSNIRFLHSKIISVDEALKIASRHKQKLSNHNTSNNVDSKSHKEKQEFESEIRNLKRKIGELETTLTQLKSELSDKNNELETFKRGKLYEPFGNLLEEFRKEKQSFVEEMKESIGYVKLIEENACLKSKLENVTHTSFTHHLPQNKSYQFLQKKEKEEQFKPNIDNDKIDDLNLKSIDCMKQVQESINSFMKYIDAPLKIEEDERSQLRQKILEKVLNQNLDFRCSKQRVANLNIAFLNVLKSIKNLEDFKNYENKTIFFQNTFHKSQNQILNQIFSLLEVQNLILSYQMSNDRVGDPSILIMNCLESEIFAKETDFDYDYVDGLILTFIIQSLLFVDKPKLQASISLRIKLLLYKLICSNREFPLITLSAIFELCPETLLPLCKNDYFSKSILLYFAKNFDELDTKVKLENDEKFTVQEKQYQFTLKQKFLNLYCRGYTELTNELSLLHNDILTHIQKRSNVENIEKENWDFCEDSLFIELNFTIFALEILMLCYKNEKRGLSTKDLPLHTIFHLLSRILGDKESPNKIFVSLLYTVFNMYAVVKIYSRCVFECNIGSSSVLSSAEVNNFETLVAKVKTEMFEMIVMVLYGIFKSLSFSEKHNKLTALSASALMMIIHDSNIYISHKKSIIE